MADFTFVEKRPMDGHEHQLDAGASVGREGCDVVLADPEVSRRHALLRTTDSGPAVEDLGSTNGTFVNGQQITGLVQIAVGDLVRFGNTEWELRATATAAAAPAGVGSPQVTAARSVPVEAPPAAAPAAAAPAAAAPAAPAAPAAAPVAAAPAAAAPQRASGVQSIAASVSPGVAGEGRRGDVPLPSESVPSAIRRTIPAEQAKAPPGFAPSTPQKVSGSAATRGWWTAFCFILMASVIAVLLVYFLTR